VKSVWLLLLCSALASYAADTDAEAKAKALVSSLVKAPPIEGAFGIKLGQEYVEKNRNKITQAVRGIPSCYFSPTNRHSRLPEYMVLLTPKTQRVYSIWVLGYEDLSKKELRDDMNNLVASLEEKYGTFSKPTQVENRRTISRDQKSIAVYIDEGRLQLLYTDDALAAQAMKERDELENPNPKKPDL
jgi:hypothetical protein